MLKARGEPVEIVYAGEGTPLITGPVRACHGQCAQPQRGAAVPSLVDDRARRSSSTSMSARCDRCIRRSRTAPTRKKLSDIKLMKEDGDVVADQADAIKARYVKIFKV